MPSFLFFFSVSISTRSISTTTSRSLC
jgi:hypothetical protein